MKMDFSKFKKVSSDDKKTVLMHPRGHKIEIAHHVLPKEQVKALKELPHFDEGGEVSGLHADYSKKDSDSSTDVKRSNVQKGFTGHSQAGHNDTDAEYAQRQKEHPGHSVTRLTLPAGMHWAKGGQIPGYDEGGDVDAPMSLPENTPMGQFGLNPEPEPNMSMPPQAGATGDFGAAQPNSEQLSNVQIPMPAQAAPQGNLAQLTGGQLNATQQGMNQLQGGISAQAAAEGQQGKMEAEAAKQHQSKMQELEQHFQTTSQSIDAERQAVYKDLQDGHIDPQHYMHSMSGFGQAMTAIGLFLGGIGGGANGPNVAMDFLNKQIDRDIEGQRAEMGKKENLLSHLNQQFGNVKDASIMAKAMQADMYAAKMQEVAAQSKNPIAIAKAQQAAAQLHLQYEPQLAQMKMNQALLSGSESGKVSPEVLIQHSPLIPEHQRPEMVKQLGKLRSLEGLRSNMNDSFNQIASKTLNGAFSPNDVESAKQAFTGKLVQLSEGRYNYEAAQNLTNAMFPSKTDSKSTVDNKRVRLDSLIDSMAAEPRSALEGVGIKVPKNAASKFNRR